MIYMAWWRGWLLHKLERCVRFLPNSSETADSKSCLNSEKEAEAMQRADIAAEALLLGDNERGIQGFPC